MSASPVTSAKTVIIIGGSITGLTGALALKAQGFDVTIVERDPSPDVTIQPENSARWKRRGAPHALQPHILSARLRNVLHEWYPDLIQDLLAAGAWEHPVEDSLHPRVRAAHRPSPDEVPVTILMSRRTTLELVMRRHVERHGVATLHAGAQVLSLIVEGDFAPLTVRGVRIKDAEGEHDLRADVVIDASGRTTKFADQLRALGATIEDEHHASNSVYYCRHYRLRAGKAFPKSFGLFGALFGDINIVPLPADNGAFVVTAAIYKDDPLLYQGIDRVDVFDEICRRTPRVAPWVDPQLSEPTSAVMGWASMDFHWRTTLKENQPQVLGFFFAGDTMFRSNPKYGRGCTCGAIGSRLLADTLASEADPAARVRQYEAALRSTFRKEWESLLAADRADYRKFQVAAGLRSADFSDRLQSTLQDHILKRAMVVDPKLNRKFMKGFFGLEDTAAWLKDPITWMRLAVAALPIHDKALFKDLSARPSRAAIKALIETPATS